MPTFLFQKPSKKYPDWPLSFNDDSSRCPLQKCFLDLLSVDDLWRSIQTGISTTYPHKRSSGFSENGEGKRIDLFPLNRCLLLPDQQAINSPPVRPSFSLPSRSPLVYPSISNTDECHRNMLQSALKLVQIFYPNIQIMSNKLIKSINDRFQQQGGHEQAIELDLSNLELATIAKDVKKVLEKAKGIEVLVISENKLTSLDGLPDWKLSSLNASTNKLNDAAIPRIAKFTELSELILTANDIKKMQSLAPLYSLKNLEEIDLSENPVSEVPGYRETLFKQIASLKVIDGLDRQGKEVEEQFQEDDEDDDEEGSDEDFEDDEDEEEESESKEKKKK